MWQGGQGRLGIEQRRRRCGQHVHNMHAERPAPRQQAAAGQHASRRRHALTRGPNGSSLLPSSELAEEASRGTMNEPSAVSSRSAPLLLLLQPPSCSLPLLPPNRPPNRPARGGRAAVERWRHEWRRRRGEAAGCHELLLLHTELGPGLLCCLAAWGALQAGWATSPSDSCDILGRRSRQLKRMPAAPIVGLAGRSSSQSGEPCCAAPPPLRMLAPGPLAADLEAAVVHRRSQPINQASASGAAGLG